MVNFEDGELVKGAYVVIDGKEYEVHMPQYSGRTPLSSENLNKMQVEILKTMLPVGSRYVTQDNTNPSEILGFGTWERLKGKVCLGLDEDDTDFNTIGKTGGEKTHTLTKNEMPNHNHNIITWNNYNSGTMTGVKVAKTIDNADGNSSSSQPISGAGGGEAHNNLQPYTVVGYMWIRRL